MMNLTEYAPTWIDRIGAVVAEILISEMEDFNTEINRLNDLMLAN